LPGAANPGDYSKIDDESDCMYKDGKVKHTPEEITEFVKRDMDTLGKNVRVVQSPSDKLDDEYIVAMRTATRVYPLTGLVDYHFAVQLSDGSWADKPGPKPSRWNVLDGPTIAWDLDGWRNYYDIGPVYFAVTR
jgi:hypothetical protein